MQKPRKISIADTQISVLMPVYNGERYVEEAIDSILEQTLPNWELIIVDDGSTDSTPIILKKYERSESRVRVITHENNQGITTSRNDCLKNANGRYFAILDSDDIACNNRLKTQYEFLEHNKEVYAVGSNATIINEKGKTLRVQKFPNGAEIVKNGILTNKTPIHSTMMFRNTGKFKYREKAIYCEDLDFYLQILADGLNIDIIPEPLIKYRLSDFSDSTINSAKYEVFALVLRNWYRNKVKYNVDIYDKIDIELLKKDAERKNTEEYSQSTKIQRRFALNNRREVQKLSWDYFKRFKVRKKVLKYFVASFLPMFMIDLLRDFKSY